MGKNADIVVPMPHGAGGDAQKRSPQESPAAVVQQNNGTMQSDAAGPNADEHLMTLVAAGDHDAYRLLVNRHLPRALSLSRRIMGDAGIAEEVVQEAFLRVWVKASAWRPRDSISGGAMFSTWLHRVLVNLCIDRKRQRPLVDLESAGELTDPAPRADDMIERDERKKMLDAAMAELPLSQKTALALCHFQGLSNIEAAAAMSLTVGAVESLLVRARRTLRRSLETMAGEPRRERA